MTVPMARSFAGQPDNKQQEKQPGKEEVGVEAMLTFSSLYFDHDSCVT